MIGMLGVRVLRDSVCRAEPLKNGARRFCVAIVTMRLIANCQYIKTGRGMALTEVWGARLK